MEFIAECYANKSIAEKLLQILSKKVGLPAKVKHSFKHGRDRVIKELMKGPKDKLVIGVIDYEEGIARTYIDKNFKLMDVWENQILIGISKHRGNVIVVIFDPKIEEAFICKVSEELCENIYQLNRLRTREAQELVKKLINKHDAEVILQAIAIKLIMVIKNKEIERSS